MVTIHGEYSGDLHCVATHEPSGTVLNTDAPKDNQGRGEAFSPTDLVATAYVTCIATTMAIVARRHGVELNGLRYTVTKEMSAELPRRIARLVGAVRDPRRTGGPRRNHHNLARTGIAGSAGRLPDQQFTVARVRELAAGTIGTGDMLHRGQ